MKKIYSIPAFIGGVVFIFTGSLKANDFKQIKTPEDFQAALTQAQNNGEDDEIRLPGKTFLTSGGPFTYTPTENHTLTITGANGKATKLDGHNTDQVLSIDTSNLAVDDNASVTIKKLAIENGSSGTFGGGLGVLTNDADITVENCIFSNNSVTTPFDNSGGAGLLSFGSGNISVTDSIFVDNSATQIGGLRADSRSGTINVTNNTFTANRAVGTLGGQAGLSVGLRDGDALIMNNIFEQNQAAGGGAGGVGITANGSGTATVVNNIFNGNTAGAGQDGFGGGGLAAGINGFGNLIMTNNTFFMNNTQDAGNGPGNGGGVYVRLQIDTEQALLYNNIVINNTADGNGDDIYVADDGSSSNHDNVGSVVVVSHNDFGDFFSFCLNTPTCAPNAHVTQTANLDVDPLFSNPTKGNLHLTQGSPVIDQGDGAAPSLPATDFEGDPRVVGPAPDIGADEFIP